MPGFTGMNIAKAITKEKLFFTLAKIRATMKIEADDAIIIKNTEGISKIMLSTLIYVEVGGGHAFYHIVSGKVIECIRNFYDVCEQRLKCRYFLKSHRWYMVNCGMYRVLKIIR